MKLKFIAIRDSIIKDYLFECGVSKRLGRKIKLYGMIFVNGIEKRNWETLKKGDELVIFLPQKVNENIILNENKIKILYEDEYILIVDKEENLAIQPSRKHLEDNLIARVLNYFKMKNTSSNCHVVTRLDYATSGIVIIAKNAYVKSLLAKTDILKKYFAKVSKKLNQEVGKICLPIARDLTSSIKRKVDNDGKESITLYEFIKELENGYLYELTLVTGRTHQIRVHLAHLGSPIVGDELYLGEKADRLYLHSAYINFVHPITKEEISINSEIVWK